MTEVSRTARVIQNAKVALFFYCINLILQFFSRKIFLDYLGAELLGLNTTAQNLLQFLNLAESGIGAAVAFALYKPLSQKNRQEIIDIVSLQGWLYRWVGLFVIAGSIVLMAFFPWIFAKADVPLIYAYGTFIAFLISALLGYFVNYKMIVLSADQKEYKITIETQSIKVIKVLIQMLAIWKLPHGYVWWMVLEVLAAIATSIRLHYCVKKEYPWLCPDLLKGKQLKQRYPFLLVKTKQLFFHKISALILPQVTPFVIYGFSSLTTVAIYGNYSLIMGSCLMLVYALSRGIDAGIGSLVAERDISSIKRIFWEFTSLRLFLGATICSDIYFMINPFIQLWLGTAYEMEKFSMVIMATIFFVQMSRTCDVFLSAFGLFHDTWAPVAELALNVGLSVILGSYWGLSGILMGVLISQILIVVFWKAFFLYKNAFSCEFSEWIVSYLKKLLKLAFVFILCVLLTEYFFDLTVRSYADWLLMSIIRTVLYSGFAFLLLFFTDRDFNRVSKKIIRIKGIKKA